ncbi:hypothetical protein D3C80_2080960 [compost metagenome]
MVVGNGHCLVLIVERRHGQYGAEDFFTRQGHVGGNAGKNARFDEIVRAIEAQLPAATDQLRPLAPGLFDVLHDSLRLA